MARATQRIEGENSMLQKAIGENTVGTLLVNLLFYPDVGVDAGLTEHIQQ